jgi:hypothetical protein
MVVRITLYGMLLKRDVGIDESITNQALAGLIAIDNFLKVYCLAFSGFMNLIKYFLYSARL